jgi:Flp pilus assembly protein TadG
MRAVKRPVLARAPARDRQRGQAMTEFAMVATVLFFLVLAVMEAGLLSFSIATARFAAGDAARVGAQEGNYYVDASNNADVDVCQTVRASALGTTAIAAVDGIDIQKVDYNPITHTLTPNPAYINSYNMDATCSPQGAINWPVASRNVTVNSDFLQVSIRYRYVWKSGAMLSPSPVVLSVTYIQKIEPQIWS